MEKKVYTLNVDPELRDLIPPLTEEEHQMLEDSIVRDGCDTPLVVWNGTIVDGHNRYEICQKHQVPFSYEERSFAGKEAAMFWMLEHQLARRNLNPYQRSEMALRLEPMFMLRAKETQGTRSDLNPNFGQNSAQSSGGRTSHKIAEIAGVSHDTIKKVKKLSADADESTKKKLRSGEISIHGAYTDLMNKEHEGETIVCECCGLEKPVSEFRILSSGKSRYPLCKECEGKARAMAKKVKEAATRPIVSKEGADLPVSITGEAVVDGRLAHVPTMIHDEPDLFDHVASLLGTAANAYITMSSTAISQYRPSMITRENTDAIRRLIRDTAKKVEAALNDHLNNEKEEV